MMPIYENIYTEYYQKFDASRKISQADDPISCKFSYTINIKAVISVCNSTNQGKFLSGNGCGSCSSGICSSCHH